MALFDTSDEAWERERRAEKKADAIRVQSEREELRLSGRYQSIYKTVGDLIPGTSTHYMTSGAWSMHDLLKYVVNRIGPCDVDAFTFAWGPAATREIGRLCELGEIRKIRIAINTVMRRWCAAAIIKMRDYGLVVTIPIHAKGFTASNDKWTVSCIGSANFSNDLTIECGVLSTERKIFDFHKQWLDHLFKTGDEFLVDKVLDKITEPEPPEISSHVLYLIRGLPGAGKTTIAHHIADAVFEIDDYFGYGENYHFNPDALTYARAECLMHTREAMEAGQPRIAVANHFIDESEMVDYYELAKVYGYTVFSFIMENRTGNQNIHGFTDGAMEAMRKRIKVKL